MQSKLIPFLLQNSTRNIPPSVNVSTLQLVGITSYCRKYAKSYESTPKCVLLSRGSHLWCSMPGYLVPDTASLCRGEYVMCIRHYPGVPLPLIWAWSQLTSLKSKQFLCTLHFFQAFDTSCLSIWKEMLQSKEYGEWNTLRIFHAHLLWVLHHPFPL